MGYLAEIEGLWCEDCKELVILEGGGLAKVVLDGRGIAKPGATDLAAECSHWQALRHSEQSPDWVPVRIQVSALDGGS